MSRARPLLANHSADPRLPGVKRRVRHLAVSLPLSPSPGVQNRILGGGGDELVNAPLGPPEPPREPQEASKTLQKDPEWPKDRSKMLQNN